MKNVLKMFVDKILNFKFRSYNIGKRLNSIKNKFDIPLDAKNCSNVVGERLYMINKNEGVRMKSVNNVLKIEREMSPDWVSKSPLKHLNVTAKDRPLALIHRTYTPGKRSHNCTERVFTTRKGIQIANDYRICGTPTIHRPSY